MGIFAVQLLVLGGRKALPAPYTAMWHGSWVLIQRRCHWVTTLLVMMILTYVTGTHTIILDHFCGISFFKFIHVISLSLSLFTFFFRGEEGSKCRVISFIFHSARSNHPILITIDITFVRAPLLSPLRPWNPGSTTTNLFQSTTSEEQALSNVPWWPRSKISI